MDFAAYLDVYKVELGIDNDRYWKNYLYAKLRPELQKAIASYSEVPKTREMLLVLTSCIESIGRCPRKEQKQKESNMDL